MKSDRALLIFAGLSFLAMGISYFFLPASIPLHWDAVGRIDSWGGRANVFWIGALPLVFYFLMNWLPRIDPNREAFSKHAKTWQTLKLILVFGLAALGWVSVGAAFDIPLDVGTVVRVLVGLLFIGLGNYMGRLKRNWFVGIKTPWALSDDEVWRLTHRRGGYVFVVLGLVLLVSALIPSGRLLGIVVFGSVIGGTAYVFLYSYLVWRRIHGPGAKPGPK